MCALVCASQCFVPFKRIYTPFFFTLTPPRPKIDFGKWCRSRHDDVRFFLFFRLFDFVLFLSFQDAIPGFFPPPNIFHIFTVGKWGGKFLQSHVAWVKVELCSVDYPSLNPFADCNGTFLFRVGVTLSWTFQNGLRSINKTKKDGSFTNKFGEEEDVSHHFLVDVGFKIFIKRRPSNEKWKGPFRSTFELS